MQQLSPSPLLPVIRGLSSLLHAIVDSSKVTISKSLPPSFPESNHYISTIRPMTDLISAPSRRLPAIWLGRSEKDGDDGKG